MKKYFSFFISAGIVLATFTATAQPAQAAITTTYTGCFERLQPNATSSVLWLNAPICTVRATNNGNSEDTFTYSVENLDPAWYLVEDLSGVGLPASRGGTRLTFSITLGPGQIKTVNVSPWDYDPDTREFWFAGISDTQTKSGSGRPNNVFITIMDQLEAIRPQFTTVSGDIVGGDESDAADHDAELEEYFDEFNEHNGSTYTVPGDHDERQDVEEYYSAYFGEDQWTFVYGNTRFLGFHTAEVLEEGKGYVTEEQFDWLESVLTSASEENIIVMQHHGIITPDWANAQGIDPDLRLQLAQLYVDNDVDVVLAGDAHGYDDTTITSAHVAGLQGSLKQLTIGGAGGNMKNYDDTDHFFTLLHIDGDNVTHQLFDYSEFDLSIEYDNTNDGTESRADFTITNNSTYDIPYMRAQVNLDASEKVYARNNTTGEFIPLVSATVEEILRGYVELYVQSGESMAITVKEYTRALTNTANQYGKDGLITYETLPLAKAVEIPLTLVPTRKSTVTITEWDEDDDKRKWNERTKEKVESTYTISRLDADRQYNIFVDDTFAARASSDPLGYATFSYKSKIKNRDYRMVEEHDRVAQYVGAMPASDGGANVSMYNGNGKKINSYFPYSNLSGGFDSIWADLDGDSVNEVVYAPKKGNAAQLVATERDGTSLAKVKPFGKDFKGGVQMIAADVNNNGKQELIVTADENFASVVHVYSYRAKSGRFKKIDQFRVFKDSYNKGLNLAAGDVNGKRGDEIIVGAQEQRNKLYVYRWNRKQKEMKRWKTKAPFTNADATEGLSIAAGDIDYDGRDEILAGTESGSAMVKIYDFKKKTKKIPLLTTKRAYKSTYTGGVDILVGNLNKNNREEFVVVPKETEISNANIKLYRLKGKSKIRKIGNKKPFGSTVAGLNVALADINNDWKQEIITSRTEGKSDVKIYRKNGSKLPLVDSYQVYEASFGGGIELTQ